MIKQVGLLPAGCQPWNNQVCAASGDRFAYCATLAIYVYEVSYIEKYLNVVLSGLSTFFGNEARALGRGNCHGVLKEGGIYVLPCYNLSNTATQLIKSRAATLCV